MREEGYMYFQINKKHKHVKPGSSGQSVYCKENRRELNIEWKEPQSNFAYRDDWRAIKCIFRQGNMQI